MPLLRSKTRGEAKIKEVKELIQTNPLSTSLPSVKSTVEDQVTTTTPVLSVSPAVTTTTTMFPFPPAPVISSTISSPAVNIINISNASSESSSETSSSASNKSGSPVAGQQDQSELLNLTMVEETGLEDDSLSLQEVPDHLGKFSHAAGRGGLLQQQTLPGYYQPPIMMQQPSTPSVVYNLVSQEQVAAQEDRDHALLLCLQQFQCYDDEAGMMLRSKVVTELDTLVKQWIRSEGLRKRITWSQLEQVGGKVVSYGSFKLSVVDKESDLDLLCVVPKLVTRDQFFSTLYDLLLKKVRSYWPYNCLHI